MAALQIVIWLDNDRIEQYKECLKTGEWKAFEQDILEDIYNEISNELD